MARRKNRSKRRKQTRLASSPARSPSPPLTPPTPPTFLGHRIPLPATLPALTLCALIVAAFFPALGGGFVWDDFAFTDAAPVQSWGGIAQIWFAPATLTDEGHYWPLLYTTFWLEHKLWGYNPLGFHAVNLILHAAVTLLLWRLLVRMHIPGAFVAAAAFAVHPVHTEAVAWIIGRKDVLAAAFFLSSALWYIRFTDDRRRRDYAFALALFVAGMLSKSTVVMLPAALLVWHWWRRGVVTVADLMRLLPFALAGAAMTVADWSYYTGREAVALGYTFIERALIASQALWFYAGKLFLPTELMVIYPKWDIGAGNPVAWIYFIAAAALACTLWFYRHRLGRGPLAGVAFFAVTLAPVLGLIDYGYMQFAFAADRYQYLAAAGIIVVVTAAAAQLIRRLPATAAKMVAPTVAVVALSPLVALSWQQAGIYKDNFTFYSYIIAHNFDARNAHYNLAREHQQAGRLQDAYDAYAIASSQRPDWRWPHIGLGRMASDLGRTDAAETHFEAALKVAPRSPDVLNYLGAFRLKQRRYREALALFQTLIELDPQQAKPYSGRGVALAGLDRNREALKSFDRALELDPSLTEAKSNRERLLQMMEDEPEE